MSRGRDKVLLQDTDTLSHMVVITIFDAMMDQAWSVYRSRKTWLERLFIIDVVDWITKPNQWLDLQLDHISWFNHVPENSSEMHILAGK